MGLLPLSCSLIFTIALLQVLQLQFSAADAGGSNSISSMLSAEVNDNSSLRISGRQNNITSHAQISHGQRMRRHAKKGERFRWPKGIVPFKLDHSIDKKRTKSINDAIGQFKENTCIRWVPRTGEKDYVEFTIGNGGCSSVVGRVGGRQTIELGHGCHSVGTVLHEMMHALGFHHEHSRPDRNEHVRIVEKNIKSDDKSQFERERSSDVTTLGEPYDHKSIMHYEADTFSKNRKATIVAKGRSIKDMGNVELSKLDIIKLRRYYKCSGSGSTEEKTEQKKQREG